MVLEAQIFALGPPARWYRMLSAKLLVYTDAMGCYLVSGVCYGLVGRGIHTHLMSQQPPAASGHARWSSIFAQQITHTPYHDIARTILVHPPGLAITSFKTLETLPYQECCLQNTSFLLTAEPIELGS